MRVKIHMGFDAPLDKIWDDEVDNETLGGIILAFLELSGAKVLVMRSDGKQEGDS